MALENPAGNVEQPRLPSVPLGPMAKDHFVPRHYLRQFAVHGLERIMVSKVSPYRHEGEKGLGWACQQLDFYESDKALNETIWTCENELAPVLVQVVKKEDFTEPELVALRWLAVTLHFRTKKAVEAFKVFPKRICYEVIQNAIDQGELPPPPDGKWTEEMVDFNGVPGFLWKNSVIRCSLEMQTLACKLLRAPDGVSFITSDNPVLALNQFCSGAERFRNFVGFAKSGFQLVMPISPKLCVFFYDARVYKVGLRRHRLVPVSAADVEIVNALQMQSAEEFVLFHEPTLESEVKKLVARYAALRVPVEGNLQTLAGSREGEQLFHSKKSSVKLPRAWAFCRMRRHFNASIGDRRDPAWTALIGELMDDFEKNPNGGDIPARIEQILADPSSLKNIRLR
jgi:hypothetical protein